MEEIVGDLRSQIRGAGEAAFGGEFHSVRVALMS